MALTRTGDGVYDGVLNEHWTIGEKVHGGAMLALCAECRARRALGPRAQGPRAGGAGDAGDAGDDVRADRGVRKLLVGTGSGADAGGYEVRKRGRRVSLIDVELNAGRP